MRSEIVCRGVRFGRGRCGAVTTRSWSPASPTARWPASTSRADRRRASPTPAAARTVPARGRRIDARHPERRHRLLHASVSSPSRPTTDRQLRDCSDARRRHGRLPGRRRLPRAERSRGARRRSRVLPIPRTTRHRRSPWVA